MMATTHPIASVARIVNKLIPFFPDWLLVAHGAVQQCVFSVQTFSENDATDGQV